MGIDYIIIGDNIKTDEEFVSMMNSKKKPLLSWTLRVYNKALSEFLKEGSDVPTRIDYKNGSYVYQLISKKEISNLIENGVEIEMFTKFNINQFIRNLVDVENLDYMELNFSERELCNTILKKYEDIKELITDDFHLYYYVSV